MAKKYLMLICSNVNANNNKFYEIKLEDDDRVVVRYGRVGVEGVTEEKGYGEALFDKVAKDKQRPKKDKEPYRPVDIMTTESIARPSLTNLAEVAKRDVANNDPILSALVEKLAKINRHQLLGATGGNIDIVDGQVKTPVGLVTLDAINKAKGFLSNLNNLVNTNAISSAEYANTLQDYLSVVPQKVPLKRGWHETFFTEFTNFPNQSALLEQIELSIKNYQPPVRAENDKPIERLFGYSLTLLDDSKTFDIINTFYKSNINSRHVSSSHKLKRVFTLTNDDKLKRYEEIAGKIGNVKRLWHGTRACNVLSIMKGGLICPPRNATNFTLSGLMFGPGVYFSDQSSKSLNYATNFWSGGAAEKDELYMFLANTAMGKEYIPRGPINQRPAGYDSIFAIGGKSGVMNNEMIVPDVNQFQLQYLCEFDK